MGRRLGLDVGDARIGVALSDETDTLATGLITLTRVGPRKDVRAVADLVREHGVGEVVVGLPKRLDGTLGRQAEKVLAFVAALRAALPVPIETWDERLTTVEAERVLRLAGAKATTRKASIDRVAAVLILQSYLDARAAAKPTA
jgi:putative Holliday junction resolvase